MTGGAPGGNSSSWARRYKFRSGGTAKAGTEGTGGGIGVAVGIGGTGVAVAVGNGAGAGVARDDGMGVGDRTTGGGATGGISGKIVGAAGAGVLTATLPLPAGVAGSAQAAAIPPIKAASSSVNSRKSPRRPSISINPIIAERAAISKGGIREMAGNAIKTVIPGGPSTVIPA